MDNQRVPEDIRQVLIGHIEKWQAATGPGGFGLVVDREGQYYFVGYAGMGNIQFLIVDKTNPFFTSIVDLVNEGRLTPEAFKATYELGFKEVAYLNLEKQE